MTCDDRQTSLVLGDRSGWDAHVESCAHCRAAAPRLEEIRLALASDPDPIPPPALHAAIDAAALPLLRRRAAAASRLPRLGAAIAAALAPLVILIPLNLLGLWGLHATLTLVLPRPISMALVLSQATLLTFLLALTYASVPLLAHRQRRALLEEATWTPSRP